MQAVDPPGCRPSRLSTLAKGEETSGGRRPLFVPPLDVHFLSPRESLGQTFPWIGLILAHQGVSNKQRDLVCFLSRDLG